MGTKSTLRALSSARALVFAAGALGFLGCGALLGIEDVSLNPTGSGGAGGGGGQGGQGQQDFVLAIKPRASTYPMTG